MKTDTRPILITNFKAYEQAVGAKALDLARLHQDLANHYGVRLAVAVQAMDLQAVASEVEIPVFAQHVDGVAYGPYTGSIPVAIAKAQGVDGSLLNHSEMRLSDRAIELAISEMKKLEMYSLVCAENEEEGHRFAEMGADFVAVEPPELIGGTVSVSSAKPELIEEAVRRIGEGVVIVGAGIKTGEDVRRAIELGAKGVLVASGVVCQEDPAKALKNLIQGLL